MLRSRLAALERRVGSVSGGSCSCPEKVELKALLHASQRGRTEPDPPNRWTSICERCGRTKVHTTVELELPPPGPARIVDASERASTAS